MEYSTIRDTAASGSQYKIKEAMYINWEKPISKSTCDIYRYALMTKRDAKWPGY